MGISNQAAISNEDVRSVSLISRVEAELIGMLYQQGYTALRGVIATATGIAVVFYNHVADPVVFGWLISIYILSFVRYLSIKKFKSFDKEAIDTARWGKLFAFFTFLSGLTWGLASIIFFLPDNIEMFNILTLIIIAMSVGSLAALSAYPKAFYLFVVPAMLPMIWRYLSIDQQYYMIFGILLFVFNFALFSIARVNNRMLYDSVLLRFENVELIAQITEQKEKAEQANISKTKFLASASHDMRQPLHAMGLFLGILEERVSNDENRVIVQKIQKSSSALSDLLDSLLDISKLDAGVIRVRSQVFNIGKLLEVLEDEFQPLASEKNLKIRFVDTDLWVNSDYRIIERIMRNLISNAIRYTDSGGVLIGCRRHKGKFLLAVYDTGIGIKQEDMKNIFEEFHQLHNTERDRSKGLGLGLAIVKRMADLVALPLYVKSVPQSGSVFGLILSAVNAPGEAGGEGREMKSIVSSLYDGYTVLIVDDESDIRESLVALLQSWNCNAITAFSGDDAIDVLGKSDARPDVILADYRLRDGETGSDVIDRVNQFYKDVDALGSKTPVAIPAIIITGDTAPERIQEAESSGYEILHKPVLPERLRMILAEVFKAGDR